MGNTISYEERPHELRWSGKGAVRGLQFDNKARRYAGIPYALPPTGDHRWRKPRPLPPSYVYRGGDGDDEADSPLDATQFRAVCPQNAAQVGGSTKAEGGSGLYSEDCLYLNIWTPVDDDDDDDKAKAKAKKWPVMLWLHGGWFQLGDPMHEPGMDATELISTGGLNAVVVGIGYRLNIFGFLAGPDLLDESAGESAGNLGLWDQRLAVEWVHENIHLFGGDADNVTLAGRSAGAYSVEAQMLYEFRRPASPASSSPFHRVFMDSNAVPAQPKLLRESQAQFDEVCEYFNVARDLSAREKLARLRRLSAAELLEAIPKLKHHTFRPVTDDLFIHPGMMEYLKSKAFAREFQGRKFKLLIGEVANEETLYSNYNSPTEPTLEALKLQIANYYSLSATNRVLQIYPLPQSNDLAEWKTTFGRIISDGQVRAPSRALVKHLVANGVGIGDLWRYQIAYRLSFITEKVAPISFGVAHAMDRPFWSFALTYGPTPQERTLMEDWIRILVAFVKGDEAYDFGTRALEEMKVITPAGSIEIQQDERWDELVKIGEIFSSDA